MRSVTLAILWEFWRCGRAICLSMLLMVVIVSIVPIFGEWLNGRLEYAREPITILHFFSVVLQLIAYPSAVLIAQGHPSRHYPRPVSTTLIVGCQLLSGAAASAALSLAVTGLMNVIFGLNWPYLGPALLIAATTTCIQGTTWFGRGSQAIQSIGGAAAFGIPIFWFKARTGLFPVAPEHYWSEMTLSQLGMIAAFAIAGSVLALVAITRDRRGDTFRWFRVQEFLDRLTVPFSADAPFRNATHAQLWFEWRQKGWWLPIAMLCALLLIVLLYGWNRRIEDLQHGLQIVAFTLIAGGVAAGVILGRYNAKPGRYEMGTFLATRPISDSGITGSTFVTGALSLTLAFVLWVGASSLVSVPASSFDPANRLTMEAIIGIAISALSMGWLILSLIICVMMTGRPKAFLIALNVVVLLFLASVSAAQYLRFGGDARVLTLVTTASALVTLSATAIMYFKACRRHLIGWKTASVGLALPMLALLFAINGHVNGEGPDLRAIMAGVMAAGLFAMPLAAGPLAIAWNRHR